MDEHVEDPHVETQRNFLVAAGADLAAALVLALALLGLARGLFDVADAESALSAGLAVAALTMAVRGGVRLLGYIW